MTSAIKLIKKTREKRGLKWKECMEGWGRENEGGEVEYSEPSLGYFHIIESKTFP